MITALKNIALKCFLLLIAIQILNESIDAIEFRPIAVTNTSSVTFNDINSATEYISEIVLGNKDAFPEATHKLPKQKTTQNLKHSSIKIYEPKPLVFTLEQQFVTVVASAFPLDEKYSFLFSKDITPPPPKASFFA